MNATIENLLATARVSRDPDEAVFALDCAEKEIAKFHHQARQEALATLAAAAADQLDVLENIRRLLAFAKSSGRGSAQSARILNLLNSKPAYDRTTPIKAQLPAFEWLRANRDNINDALDALHSIK